MFDVAVPQQSKQTAVPQPAPVAALLPVRPRLRGIPDVFATLAAVPAVIVLLLRARPGTFTQAAAVYGACLIGLFFVSAMYHTFLWPKAIRRIWRRIDHSMVYVLIAGSYTPVCLVALEPETGRTFLAVVWTITLLGFLKSFFWETSPRWLNTGIYLVMGWLLVPIIPAVYRGLGTVGFVLIGLGGVVYTLGALVYARRWPNPDPKVFGYHEVFHLFVMAAASCHFATMWHILT